MKETKTFYGNAILQEDDLKETEISNKIVLDYYRVETANEDSSLKEPPIGYGIEIIKKEYFDEQNFSQEKNCIKNISQNEGSIEQMLSKLKKYKVTPVGLGNVIDDLRKSTNI